MEAVAIVKKERIAWIDNIKLFAILCVVLYHSCALVANEKYYVGWVIETFNMALFFFLSGLTSYGSVGRIVGFKDLVDFGKKKFLRIMLPCMFVSLLVFQKPCSFWFLLTLFYYLMAFAVCHYVCKLTKISENWAFLLFLSLLLVNVPKVGNDQEFVIPFALGMLCSKQGVIERLKQVSHKRMVWAIVGGFSIWLLLIPFYQSFYLNQLDALWCNHSLYVFGIRQVIELSFAVACCLLFMEYVNRQTKFSHWGGKL